MIMKNFLESSKHLNVSNQIPMYLLLSVLEVHTLGARAAIEMLTSSFRTNTEYPEIVFVGNHLSSSYTKELLDYLQGKDFQLTLFQNQVLRQNQQLHLDYLNNWLKKNMEKMKLRNVFCNDR